MPNKKMAYHLELDAKLRIDNEALKFKTVYSKDYLYLVVYDCQLDLQKTVRERIKNFNIRLPGEAGKIILNSFSGKIWLIDSKQAYEFTARLDEIAGPFPTINEKLKCRDIKFSFQNIPAKEKSYKHLLIAAKVEFRGTFKDAFPNADFLSLYINDTSLSYINFKGNLNLSKMIKSLFDLEAGNLSLFIENAGLLRVNAKESSQKEAFKELKETFEAGFTSEETNLIIKPFPLDILGNDFRFSNVLCFWLELEFKKITVLAKLIELGYGGKNTLMMYGVISDVKDENGKKKKNKVLYASLPRLTVLGFLSFTGRKGREGVQVKYTLTDQKKIELNGRIEIKIFNHPLAFDGDLILDEKHYEARLFLSEDKRDEVIEEPFDKMTGIRLHEFKLLITKYFPDKTKTDDKGRTDLYLDCLAQIPSLGISMEAILVFENQSPRLALLELTSKNGLTLTDFIKKLVGANWDWAGPVTDQFRFTNGEIYYLKKEPGLNDNYTFKGKVYEPSYHLRAELLIFDRFSFEIDLAVRDKGVVLLTKSLQTLDFIFLSLTDAALEISTIEKNKHFRVSSGISILEYPCGNVNANYQNGVFTGNLNVFLKNASIPTVGGTKEEDLNLDIEFKWAKDPNGLEITKINGLPTKSLDLIKQFANALDGLSKTACEKITGDLFNKMNKTKLKPKLAGSPRKDGNLMIVPLKINYTLSIAGTEVVSDDLDYHAKFAVPSSLKKLPGAIWKSILENLDSICDDIIANPKTYKILAIEAGKRGMVKLAARMVCRALDKGLKDLAKAIVAELETVVAATLAEALELALIMAAVGLAGLAAAVSGIIAVLEHIWNWLRGSDDEEKKKAERLIESEQKKIDDEMNKLFEKIDMARAMIQIKSLETNINSNHQFTANWVYKKYHKDDIGEHAKVSYELSLLKFKAGTITEEQWDGIDKIVLRNLKRTSYTKDLYSIPNHEGYLLNASVKAVLSGIVFLDKQSKNHFESSIKKLRESKNGQALKFAKDLEEKMKRLESYNNGLVSEPVFARSSLSNKFRIGKSFLGRNTRI